MPSTYTSEYPAGVSFDPAYRAFFEEFYAISDSPDAHEKYVEQFTRDAVLVMALRRANGLDEILSLRKSLWEKVTSRVHRPLRIFPYGADSDDVMLYGTVSYVLKAGGEVEVEWAARAHLVKEGGNGKVKMDFYQVYLDTAAQNQSR